MTRTWPRAGRRRTQTALHHRLLDSFAQVPGAILLPIGVEYEEKSR